MKVAKIPWERSRRHTTKANITIDRMAYADEEQPPIFCEVFPPTASYGIPSLMSP